MDWDRIPPVYTRRLRRARVMGGRMARLGRSGGGRGVGCVQSIGAMCSVFGRMCSVSGPMCSLFGRMCSRLAGEVFSFRRYALVGEGARKEGKIPHSTGSGRGLRGRRDDGDVSTLSGRCVQFLARCVQFWGECVQFRLETGQECVQFWPGDHVSTVSRPSRWLRARTVARGRCEPEFTRQGGKPASLGMSDLVFLGIVRGRGGVREAQGRGSDGRRPGSP